MNMEPSPIKTPAGTGAEQSTIGEVRRHFETNTQIAVLGFSPQGSVLSSYGDAGKVRQLHQTLCPHAAERYFWNEFSTCLGGLGGADRGHWCVGTSRSACGQLAIAWLERLRAYSLASLVS